jgi:hypothetical protein
LTDKLVSVAVLGGTGKEGSGLVLRWAEAGYRVIIGSRSAQRAADAAYEANDILGEEYVIGLENTEATEQANVVVLCVPYEAQLSTLETVRPYLDGKILVDVTVPLMPPNVRQVTLPERGAAVLDTQAILNGVDVRVVAAFQNVSAVHLRRSEHSVDCDVLICGDDPDAKNEVMHLVEAAGMRGIDAGPLVNAVAAEALTPVLLYINKRYGISNAGIRITGLA